MTSTPFDWSLGRYERTADWLEPAARVMIERAAPQPGERVLDIGCGTGNAALLATADGARTIGVDPAPRLLEVARERAAALGLDATFVAGQAEDLPVDDGEIDLVLSVFGVIFASDPRAAAAETARVTAPGGRIVLSAWLPEGPIREAVQVAREAVHMALGAPAGPPPFAWHDRDALAELFAPHGFEVDLHEERLAFTAESPRAFLDEEAEHPLAVAGWSVLEPRGESEAVRDRMLAIYEAGNEDPVAFRITSRYVVATLRR
jgi:SAM-dependent methyltransferase